MANGDKKKKAVDVGGAPPPLVDTAQNRPIGVGADYEAQVGYWTPGGSGTYGQKPRYYPGAEWGEVSGLSPEDRATLQLGLRDLGLIGPKARIVLGSWDNTSASAFRQVLAWANSQGVDWRSALDMMQTQAAAFGDLGGSAAPSRAATNPLDFQHLAKSESRDVLGRGLTPDELTKVTGKLQGAEAPYLAGDNPTSPPGSGAFQDIAQQQVRALDPVRADSRSAVKVASVIAQMLAGRMPSDSQQLPQGA